MQFKNGSSKRPLIFAILIAIIGLGCLIAGVVLISKANAKDEGKKGEREGEATQAPTCGFSLEARRVGLGEFLQQVQNEYYNLLPYLIGSKPKVQAAEVRAKFSSYDPSPGKIKTQTDKSWSLLAEINSRNIKKQKLKPRERKALSQVKHFLQHVFGSPYDSNYYAGDFLLGPNFFCWQPICSVEDHLNNSMKHIPPSTVEELEDIKTKLESVNSTFSTYIENLKYGAKAGMVRSVEECEAGITTFKNAYWSVSSEGPEGVVKSLKYLLSNAFLKIIADPKQNSTWIDKYRKPVEESMRSYLIEYVGTPLDRLLSFLETEWLQHCVPSNVSSGLATLPLSHIYMNGTPDLNSTTTKQLPDGKGLNGTRAYQQIMSYFTTSNITAKEVHQLGFKMLDELYPQVLEIARSQSGQQNNSEAEKIFKARLDEPDMYFSGNMSIPKNESDKNAQDKCRSESEAKMYCPVRWSIMEVWFNEVNQVMSLLDPKTVHMFYFTGINDSTPDCPLTVKPNYNHAAGVPSYRRSNKACTHPAAYMIPFFLNRPGPRYIQWSVNSHEARPGHHTQVQGAIEHFQDTCGGLIGWLDSITSYTSFIEGWGLYAETLIAKDTNVYDGKPLYKYGMLRSQIWRALRLVVDTGLHTEAFSRQKAYQFFVDYAWDDSDVVQKEITRYQSDPGQAVAYMVGQLHIAKLRETAKKQLGDQFNLKDFHYHLLKQGSAPLSYLSDAINEYIRCTKNRKGDGCEYVLNTGKQKCAEGAVESMDMDLDKSHYFF